MKFFLQENLTLDDFTNKVQSSLYHAEVERKQKIDPLKAPTAMDHQPLQRWTQGFSEGRGACPSRKKNPGLVARLHPCFRMAGESDRSKRPRLLDFGDARREDKENLLE